MSKTKKKIFRHLFSTWTGYGYYIYFRLLERKYCFRYIPKFDRFSKDRRIFAIWEVPKES